MQCTNEHVGQHTLHKHEFLKRYIAISSAVRRKWQPPTGAGSTYIDLFCGCGRYCIRETGELTDGSPLVAWKASRDRAPFTKMFIADADSSKRQKTAKLLRNEGAPVAEVEGDALQAVERIVPQLNPYGLHFAFLDPYSLGALDFRIIEHLAKLKRIDMLIHISKMDLQRNLPMNMRKEQDVFDRFAPGWQKHVDQELLRLCETGKPGSNIMEKLRAQIIQFWCRKISELGVWPSTRMELITGNSGQHLYWLTLAAKHDLADDFWKKATNVSQLSLDF